MCMLRFTPDGRMIVYLNTGKEECVCFVGQVGNSLCGELSGDEDELSELCE